MKHNFNDDKGDYLIQAVVNEKRHSDASSIKSIYCLHCKHWIEYAKRFTACDSTDIKKIRVNAAMCKNCNQVLVSHHVHDYQSCKCMVKANEMTRNMATDEITNPEFYKTLHGISIDGGTDYIS